jgi:hypothetical protein
MKIFRLTREGGMGSWRKLHNDELYDDFIGDLLSHYTF